MPFITGGILAEWGPPKAALLVVKREIRNFSPKSADDQYVVDFAFVTWHNFREPEEPYERVRGDVDAPGQQAIALLTRKTRQSPMMSATRSIISLPSRSRLACSSRTRPA